MLLSKVTINQIPNSFFITINKKKANTCNRKRIEGASVKGSILFGFKKNKNKTSRTDRIEQGMSNSVPGGPEPCRV